MNPGSPGRDPAVVGRPLTARRFRLAGRSLFRGRSLSASVVGVPVSVAVVAVLAASGCQPDAGLGSAPQLAQPAAAASSPPARAPGAVTASPTDVLGYLPGSTPTSPPASAPAPTGGGPAGSPAPAPGGTIPTATTPVAPAPAAAPVPVAPAPTSPAPAPAPAGGGGGRIEVGVVYSGPATHYGADGGGNCMFDVSSDPAMPFVAMNELDYENSRACGAYLEVTGPRGSVVVKVTDRCPECGPGHLDLSRQAFARIADPVAGIVDVTWRVVSPADVGPVRYRVKEGSSAYWLALQVRDHRNPVVSLEVQVAGTWVALAREQYNHFVAPRGLGPGPFTVRLTDAYGEQLVHTVSLVPGAVQTTASQFARH